MPRWLLSLVVMCVPFACADGQGETGAETQNASDASAELMAGADATAELASPHVANRSTAAPSPIVVDACGGAPTNDARVTPPILRLDFAARANAFPLRFTGAWQTPWCDTEGKARFAWRRATATSAPGSPVPCDGVVRGHASNLDFSHPNANPCLTIIPTQASADLPSMYTCDGKLDVVEFRGQLSVPPNTFITRGDGTCATYVELRRTDYYDLSIPLQSDCQSYAQGVVQAGSYTAVIGLHDAQSPFDRRFSSVFAITTSDPVKVDFIRSIDEADNVPFAGEIDLGALPSLCDAHGNGNVKLASTGLMISVCNGRFVGTVKPGKLKLSLLVTEGGYLSTITLPGLVPAPNGSAKLAIELTHVRVPLRTLLPPIIALFSDEADRSADGAIRELVPGVAGYDRDATLSGWVRAANSSGFLIPTGARYNRSLPSPKADDPFAMQPLDVIVTEVGAAVPSDMCKAITLVQRNALGQVEADGHCHLRTLIGESIPLGYHPSLLNLTILNLRTGETVSAGSMSALPSGRSVSIDMPPQPPLKQVVLAPLLAGEDLPIGAPYELWLVPIDPRKTGDVSPRHGNPLILRSDTGAAIETALPDWLYRIQLQQPVSPYSGNFGPIVRTLSP